ncbi:MAG: hypothetical protein M1840_006446 [Geoglossum simile]|nr:MAG: hypothetical protein M1840_006446 [Geoglossum simile]
MLYLDLSTSQFTLPFLASAAAISIALVLKASSSARSKEQQKATISSPRTTLLPQLSASEIRSLPYPPDVLPGGRWVESPYGAIRVYEWGPEDGRKVLLVHGISTPCITLGGIAQALVDRGCRVMTMDLFGRGYSDTPSGVPHDTRLYTTEILLAITSSPLSWTGSKRFSIIGYSLGGGISASFTSYFPHLIDSLVLLAPAGLIRPNKFSLTSKAFRSSGLFPEKFLHYFVERRIRASKNSAIAPEQRNQATNKGTTSLSDAITSELPPPIMSQAYPNVNVPRAVIWQLDHHQGFLDSFMSSIRYAPIAGQQADWRRIGSRLTAQNTGTTPGDQGLHNGQVLIIAGDEDILIDPKELQPDANDVLGGPHNVCFQIVSGGHNFPTCNVEDTMRHIAEFWSLAS